MRYYKIQGGIEEKSIRNLDISKKTRFFEEKGKKVKAQKKLSNILNDF